ncbi:hypothetical protein G9A89_011528 [Geosiphon pyriformis]|nr:hypothetical protein G9A89_011528 [Geosiphon pyriformis]
MRPDENIQRKKEFELIAIALELKNNTGKWFILFLASFFCISFDEFFNNSGRQIGKFYCIPELQGRVEGGIGSQASSMGIIPGHVAPPLPPRTPTPGSQQQLQSPNTLQNNPSPNVAANRPVGSPSAPIRPVMPPRPGTGGIQSLQARPSLPDMNRLYNQNAVSEPRLKRQARHSTNSGRDIQVRSFQRRHEPQISSMTGGFSAPQLSTPQQHQQPAADMTIPRPASTETYSEPFYPEASFFVPQPDPDPYIETNTRGDLIRVGNSAPTPPFFYPPPPAYPSAQQRTTQERPLDSYMQRNHNPIIYQPKMIPSPSHKSGLLRSRESCVNFIDDDENAFKSCKICQEGDECEDEEITVDGSKRIPKGRLISPCKCKGSLQYVHIGCLQRWRGIGIRQEAAYRCEVCQYEYKFYRPRVAKIFGSPVFLHILTTMALLLTLYGTSWLAKAFDIYVLNDSKDHAHQKASPNILLLHPWHWISGLLILSSLGLLFLIYNSCRYGCQSTRNTYVWAFPCCTQWNMNLCARLGIGNSNECSAIAIGFLILLCTVFFVFGLIGAISGTYMFIERIISKYLKKIEDTILEHLQLNISYDENRPDVQTYNFTETRIINGIRNTYGNNKRLTNPVYIILKDLTFANIRTQPNLSYKMTEKQNIIIIGGGYAGFQIAQTLDKSLSKHYQIILIERKSHFWHSIGALRSVVIEGFEKNLLIPYDQGFKHGTKVIQAEVSNIAKNEVTLNKEVQEWGSKIPFAYLVIATGSNYSPPAKVQNLNKADVIEEISKRREAVNTAEKILIIGGGPVGIELAGELATVHKDKRITIVHAQNDLLSPQFPKKLRDSLKRQLEDLNVTIIFGEKVLLPESGLGDGTSPNTLQTDKGTTIESDVQFIATGAQPNTSLVATLDESLLEEDSRLVKVAPTLQLDHEEFPHIFAVGDITNVKETKLAYRAGAQATIVVKNIEALTSGKSKKLQAYKPGPEAIFVTIGKTNGAGLLPMLGGVVVGPFMVKGIKGKNLFVDRYWKQNTGGAPPSD